MLLDVCLRSRSEISKRPSAISSMPFRKINAFLPITILAAFLLHSSSSGQVRATRAPVRSPLGLVVHGGVDDAKPGDLSAADEQAVRDGMTRALLAGYARLEAGGTSVDAVEAALSVFEDDTTFDAGRGSVVNADGVAQLDASIMDGRTMKAGSVAALEHIAHPISLARLVMDLTPHVMLVGEGAEEFAKGQGVNLVLKRLLHYDEPTSKV